MSEAIFSFSNQWDGSPSFSSPYNITFSISPESGDIMVFVDAPFHDNPAPPVPVGKVENLYDYEVVEIFLASVREDRENSPYLEIQLGPHGHYMLVFLMREADWDNQDTSLELDCLPKTWIDPQVMRWYCELSLPAHYLPEPLCKPDLSVTWLSNVCAIYGSQECRRHLSLYPCPSGVAGDCNFHQLSCFRPLVLFETREVRQVLDRGEASIFNEKFKLLNSTVPLNNGQVHSSKSSSDLLEKVNEDDELLPPSITTVVDVAKQLKEQLASKAKSPAQLQLEERFSRHIQPGELAILHGKVWKRKGLSFKFRTLILTSQPRLFYLDHQGNYRGGISWSMSARISVKVVDKSRFDISMPEGGRVYHLSDGFWGAQIWCDTINAVLDAQRSYMRKSRKIKG
ncbi:hypothetical protein EON64_05950 [archaeon]|nr:MAG: hypothetical protein EON64_05950 [archaeon]